MNQTGRMPLAFLAALLLAPALRAAEAPRLQPDDTTLDARLKALEKRIQKLEEAINKDPQTGNDWGQRHGFSRETERLLEQLQREAFGDWQGPPPGMQGMPRTPGMPGMRGMPGHKPRLGVELAASNADLRERFKNDVLAGAFVMSVLPGSPAEKAGLTVGDCVTSFNGQDIKSPPDLIAAVRAAPQGKAEIIVTRRGEALKLKVELGEQLAGGGGGGLGGTGEEGTEENDRGLAPHGGWLQRGPGPGPGNSTTKTSIAVKASALELSDELAKDLKLTAEQKTKMRAVLDKHSQKLSEEAALKTEKSSARGGLTLSLNAGVSGLVDKHVAEAEKELAGTLSPEQLQEWAAQRKLHNSLSVSEKATVENGGGGGNGGNGGGAATDDDDETMSF